LAEALNDNDMHALNWRHSFMTSVIMPRLSVVGGRNQLRILQWLHHSLFKTSYPSSNSRQHPEQDLRTLSELLLEMQ